MNHLRQYHLFRLIQCMFHRNNNSGIDVEMMNLIVKQPVMRIREEHKDSYRHNNRVMFAIVSDARVYVMCDVHTIDSGWTAHPQGYNNNPQQQYQQGTQQSFYGQQRGYNNNPQQ
eukprot:334639_1